MYKQLILGSFSLYTQHGNKATLTAFSLLSAIFKQLMHPPF